MGSMTTDVSAPLYTSPVYLDEVIRPNQSLTRTGLWVVLGVLLAFNVLVGLLMLILHAYPVPIFLGLDMVGVAIAFRVVNRRALWGERVRVDADKVTVSHEGGPRIRHVWSSPTAFTRVTLETEGLRSPEVTLHLSGRSTPVALNLGKAERARFAETLRRAISDARGERHR
jgi:uncharacterized membrane protein